MKRKLVTYGELAAQSFKPFRMFLEPWVHDETFSLLVGPRGSGKTWIAMAIAQAIASGSSFGGWPVRNRTNVLYLEGEMPLRVISKRFRQIDDSAQEQSVGGAMSIVSCDHYSDFAIPNLSDTRNHEMFDEMFHRHEVIIIDNLLNCARPIDGRDQELQIWQRTASFLKAQRSKGKAIILLHHTGKSGAQMGTMIKENDVDTFLMVTPELERKKRGFGAEIRFEKARYLEYPNNKPLWVEYSPAEDRDRYTWEIYPLGEKRVRRVFDLKSRGLSDREISEVLSIPFYMVKQYLKGATND